MLPPLFKDGVRGTAVRLKVDVANVWNRLACYQCICLHPDQLKELSLARIHDLNGATNQVQCAPGRIASKNGSVIVDAMKCEQTTSHGLRS
jgi:hypothetical protein